MKYLKKFVYFLIVFVVIAFVSVLLYMTSQKPQYNGTIQLKGLKNQVEIIYDFYGIPHIYATNEDDAYFALGYVHAQDRLFQMEMVRRIASGRLAEILGPDLIKVDAFFKTLGLLEHAKQSQELYFSSDSLQYQKSARAYLKGMNQFIESGRTPVEFLMLGIKAEKFSLSDLYLSVEYMSFNFAMGFRTDPLMSYIKSKLGAEYYGDLVTNYQKGTVVIPSYIKKDSLSIQPIAFNSVDKILELLPIPPMTGSNSWVLSPSKSHSKKVLFENDTHIAYGQPSVWYEAHIEYPGFSFYGNHLAGWPFAALGHSRNHVWGLTMFENDDLDFYSERIKPGDSTLYWSDGKWNKLSSIKKIIKVKGEEDVSITVRATRHGPLVQDVMPEWKNITSNAVSAWWTHLKFPSNLLQLTYDFSHSKSLSDFRYTASQIISPGLNIMYGNENGDIAWYAAGRLVQRKENVDPVVLQDGTKYSNDPQGYYDFIDNPKSENPPQGYVYSANNQPDSLKNGVYYPGYYCPDDRAVRINSLLNSQKDYTVEDMQRISNDVVSPATPIIAQTIVDGISKSIIKKSPLYYKSCNILLRWDGNHQLSDIGPTIYYKLVYYILHDAMADELGEENFKVFLGTHVMKNSLNSFLLNDSSIWWNNVNTRDINESRNVIFDKAFEQTINELQKELGSNIESWEWGKVHVLEHVHPIGMKKPFHLLFNVGPFPVPGGPEVINQSGFDLSADKFHKAKYGPAMRIVLDFADIENSKSILPTGQSGNVMSRYYFDQAVLYNSGKFRRQKMNRKEIELNKSGRLLLQPAVVNSK